MPAGLGNVIRMPLFHFRHSLRCALAALAFVPVPSRGADRIPAADLQTDCAVLENAYGAIHPGLYRYNTPAQMAANFASLRGQLDHDLTLPEAFLAFSVFLAKVKCGHTYANFFNQPDAVVVPLFQQIGRVPFTFRWLDRRMIVTRDLSGKAQMAPGTEMLTLNGVPAGQILDRLLTLARADGSNDAKRIDLLELHGDSRYESFDIYYSLLFPPGDAPLELRVRPPDGKPDAALTLPWQTYAERLAAIHPSTGSSGDDNQPLWTLAYPDPHLACLRMPTWATYNSHWDWKKFLDETFDQLAARKVENLVFDLRGNEGGADEGEYLLGKLARKELRLTSYKRLVRYRKVPDDLAPFLDTWDKSFKDWGDSATPGPDGYFVLHKYDDDPGGGDVIRAGPRPFVGRVFVLVDASNSSATFQFAQEVQRAGLGTLVGQPTGGNQRGINGGAFFFLRLPKSRIEADLPIIGRFPDGEPPDAGLTPDVLVQPSVRDIAQGLDPEMAAVMRLVGESR